MNNPFAIIDSRLSTIEKLLIDLKHQGVSHSSEKNILQPLPPATIKQAAEYLSISRPTLNALIKSEKITSFNIGSHVRIEWSELDKYIRNQKGGDNE